jgi:hypothetical protein
MIHCAECNEEQMDGLEYCDSCGAKLEAFVPLPVDSDGAKLEAVAAEAGTPEAETADAPDSQAAEEAPAEAEASTEAAPEAVASEEAAAETSEAEGEESAEAAGDESAEAPAAEAAPEVAAPSDDQAAGGSASLTITRGGTVGKVFELQAGDNLVGRWDPDSGSFPEVDMENDDPEARISRKHALIKFGAELTIEDIGSLNGTFVNRGQRLEPGSPVPLKDGDEIIVGKTFFKVSHAQ